MNLNIEKTQVIENARVLQGLLERAHEAGFGRWVSHAENQVFQDETEWIPDILSFTYRGTQFFARVEETEVVVEHADENRQHPEVGRVVFSSQEPLDIVNVVLRIQALLNPLIPLDICLTKEGDTLGFRYDKGADTEPIRTEYPYIHHVFAFHRVCGGEVFACRTSPTHIAMCCKACYLRVVLPDTVLTLGDLRAWAVRNSS